MEQTWIVPVTVVKGPPKKRQFNITLAPSVRKELKSLPMSMTAAVIQAIINAERDPQKLARALEQRFGAPSEGNTERTATFLDTRVTGMVERLSGVSRLSNEEVARLAIEAYIHRL